MYVLGNLLLAIAKVLDMAIHVYSLIVLGAVIVSWVRPDPYSPIVRFLRQATEPLFYQIRRLLPKSFFSFGIDLSPIILLILLQFFGNWLLKSLYQLGTSLQ